MKEKCFRDDILGLIIVKENPRARKVIMRTRPDAIYVTVPLGYSHEETQKVINEFRPRLLKSKEKVDRKPINLDFRIETEFFKLSLAQGTHPKFLAHSELGETKIICPPTANFEDEELQEWLRKVIEQALRNNAKSILPSRISQLSQKVGLPYSSLRISSSQGRWGSCSSSKNINLSYYLLLLPSHLVNYVILHELAHTKEMNHGVKFWALLDKLVEGNSQKLRAELKNYDTRF